MRLVRRTLGVALWRLGFQPRDMGPVQPASIQYVERLAVEAVFGTFDNDRDEGR